MDISAILTALNFPPQISATVFKSPEDSSEYSAWKIDTPTAAYALKKSSQEEIAVYQTFLTSTKYGAPHLHKTLEHNGDHYILIDYIDGTDLCHCNRPALTAVLDSLIYIQDKYWERRDLISVGHGYEDSLRGRRERGNHLGNPALEHAYAEFFRLYSLTPCTFCHDDLLPFNVLISSEKAVLIDWEYAGILPYPISLARLIAHGEEDPASLFHMTADDKSFAVDYYFEHLIKSKGISYADYRRTLDYFLLYEYCEWIMLGIKYGDTSSERYQKYLAKALEHIKTL